MHWNVIIQRSRRYRHGVTLHWYVYDIIIIKIKIFFSIFPLDVIPRCPIKQLNTIWFSNIFSVHRVLILCEWWKNACQFSRHGVTASIFINNSYFDLISDILLVQSEELNTSHSIVVPFSSIHFHFVWYFNLNFENLLWTVTALPWNCPVTKKLKKKHQLKGKEDNQV